MPSVTMDIQSLSSSLYSSEDISSSTERQAGLWKSHNLPNFCDPDQGTRRSLNVQPVPIFSQSSKVNDESSLFSSSLSELFSRRLRVSENNALYGHSVDSVASHCEEERLFDSLEELEAQTIGNLLPNDDDLLSGLTDGLDQIIQNSAGDDVDELDLFSSVGGMELGDDDNSSSEQKNSEFLDGDCNGHLGLCNVSFGGEHPYSERPSRTLLVRNISSDVEDSELKALFEQFGDIRTLHRHCKHHGLAIISYYDIRAAQNAMRAHQTRLFSFRNLDIHYSIPKDNSSKKVINQGTLVVSLSDSSVSNNELHHIFNVFGEIKEIRENPQNCLHKLIEFYDVRAAEAALHALNINDTIRKRLKIEPGQLGDSKSMFRQIHPELEQKEYSLYLHQNRHPLKSPPCFPGLHGVIKSGSVDGGRFLHVEPATRAQSLETSFVHGVSSSVPSTLPSVVRVKSVGKQCEITESSSPSHLNFDLQAASSLHPRSLPECHDGLANGVLHDGPQVAANINLKRQERVDHKQFFQVNSNGHPMEFNDRVSKSSGYGHHHKWSGSLQPFGMMSPNSPSHFNGTYAVPTLHGLHGLPRSPSYMMSTVLPVNDQYAHSAPALNSPLWDRKHTYVRESPEAAAFHPGFQQFSNNTAHRVDFVSQNIFPHFRENCDDLQILPMNVRLQFHNHRGPMFPERNHPIPMFKSFGTHKFRARSRRNEGRSNLADNKQYELDIDSIRKGEDNRTTLMIKNIPNKYTSKMLLAVIDECHKGTYDFVYLPIDFKNKCNVGYAFINMTDPSMIIPFYQVFNGKKWEKFNSEKVASLAYARIQGKAALIAHFQNSSLMNEDKGCRPILFDTDGPNAGDPVPFPFGDNFSNKPGRVRNNTQEDQLQGNQTYMENEELSSGGDNVSKESD